MAASLRFSAAVALLSISLLCSAAAAADFLVGGIATAWSSPSSSQALNKWAEANRFQVGDTLLWKYDGKKESVLQVTREDYAQCNKSAPIAAYDDGNTAVKLNKSGPYYFISGAEGGACEKGQKLIVVVMSARPRFAAASPAPSPAAEPEGPAAAPASGDASAVGRRAGLVAGLVVMTTTMGLVL